MSQHYVVNPHYTLFGKQLLTFFEGFSEQGEIIAKGNRNEIRKVTFGDTVFTVKKFKTPIFIQSIVYRFFRASKAKRSYEYAMKLQSFGIGTPTPVAYFERFSLGLKESYYVCEYVPYDFDFRVLIHQRSFPNRAAILQQFAAFTYQLHEAGICFLDHSPGNTLIVDKGEGVYDFYLIDLNRMRFGTLTFEQRMHNFRRLWMSKVMVRIIAEAYAKLYTRSSEEVYAMMYKYSKQFQDQTNRKKLRRRKRKK